MTLLTQDRTIEGCPIRVKPAYRSLRNVSTRDVNAHHYDIHISELDPEVKDADLYEIFKEYKSLSDVRVIWYALWYLCIH